jgi:hypothetical protein
VKCGLIETETVATIEPYDLVARTIQIAAKHYDMAITMIAMKEDSKLAYVKNTSSNSLNVYKDLAAETGLTIHSSKEVIRNLLINGKVGERKHNRQKKALYVVTSE